MSAPGQGGVSIILGANHAQLTPVTLADGQAMTFTHNAGRKAYQVLVTGSPNGQRIHNTSVAVTQPTNNTIVVTNISEAQIAIFVAARWEDCTPSLDLIKANDARIVIVPPVVGPVVL